MNSITIILVTGLNPSEQARRSRDELATILRALPGTPQVILKQETDEVDLSQIQSDKLVLIGHSFGGDQCVNWIKRAPARPIDVLYLLDPVPKDGGRRWLGGTMEVPANVLWAKCFHRDGFFHWPFSKPIKVDRPELTDTPINIGHDDFFANPVIRSDIETKIRSFHTGGGQ